MGVSGRSAVSLAGCVLPGNHVDVLLTVHLSGGRNDETGRSSTATVLQAVEVLAVAQRLDAPTENEVDLRELRSVTLLVTPQQANLLDLGQNKGKLTLIVQG